MHTQAHDSIPDRRLEPRRLLPRRQPPFQYDQAAATEIPRMAALAIKMNETMRAFQPMPDAAMDGLSQGHTAVVEALAAEPISTSADIADKLRVLADLIESDEGGVLFLETILLEATLHDLGAFRIREAIAEGYGSVETIYGELLQLRAGEFGKIDRA